MSTVTWCIKAKETTAHASLAPASLTATHPEDVPGTVYIGVSLSAPMDAHGLKLTVKVSEVGIDVVVSGYQDGVGYVPMLELPVNHLGCVIGRPRYPTPLRTTKSGILLLGRPYDTEPTT